MTGQRRTVGNVLAIPLGDGTHVFALTLPEADFAFFDSRSSEPDPPADLLSRPVLFRVAVHQSAWAAGRWPRVAKVLVPPHLLRSQAKFIQDALHPEKFEIYLAGAVRSASRSECHGLERAAVWDPEHVEERIFSHYAGVPSKWVKSLSVR
jgi:Immunity protein 26